MIEDPSDTDCFGIREALGGLSVMTFYTSTEQMQ